MRRKGVAKARIAEVESLWRQGEKAGAAESARRLFEEMPDRDIVALFYASFCFYSLRDVDLAMRVAIERLRVLQLPRLFLLLCRFYLSKNRDEDVLQLAREHFSHPQLAGPAFAAYGAVLLRRSNDLGLASGFFNRAAVFGGLGRSQDAASLISPPESFRSFAAFHDDPAQTPIYFLNGSRTKPRFVVCASGDESYFRAFFTIYRDSFFAFNPNPEHALHFHLFDPSDALLAEIDNDRGLPGSERVQFSFEKTTGSNRSYYYAGRFIQMPRLLRYYDCPIAVTDIDCVYKAAIDDLVIATQEADLGVLEIDIYVFPWENFRANMVIFNPTNAGHEFSLTLRNFLFQLPHEAVHYWYVDQLGVAECAFVHRNLGFGTIAPIGREYRDLCYQPTGKSGHPEEKAKRARDMFQARVQGQTPQEVRPDQLGDDLIDAEE